MNQRPKFDGVLFTRDQIQTRVSVLARAIHNDFENTEDTVLFLGVMDGSFTFMADLLRLLEWWNVPLESRGFRSVETRFIQARSYFNGSKSVGEVELACLPLDVKDRSVVLVEDIVDTGKTVTRVKQWLTQQGAASVKTAALLSKDGKHGHTVDYCGFRVKPDDFVVGYGMDLAGQYRELPDIWKVVPIVEQT